MSASRVRQQLRERLAEFLELHPAVLLGRRFQAIDVTAVGVFDFVAALAVFRAEQVAEDGEEPRGQVSSRFERIDNCHGTQQSFLHKIVRTVDVAAE